MKFSFAFLPLILTFLVTGCAYLEKGPTQIIHVGFNQPTETKARCFFENSLFKHEFLAPGSVRVQNSRDPIQVYCLTANGRQAEITLFPKIASAYWKNSVNLYSWTPMDILSRSAYVYPDHVVLDFDADNATVYFKAPPQTFASHEEEEFREVQAIAIERANQVFRPSDSNVSQFEVRPPLTLKDMLPDLPEPESKREIITEDDPRWDDFDRYLKETSKPDGRPLDIRPPHGFNE